MMNCYRPIRMAKMKRLNNISGIGKNVGELEFSDIAGRNVK